MVQICGVRLLLNGLSTLLQLLIIGGFVYCFGCFFFFNYIFYVKIFSLFSILFSYLFPSLSFPILLPLDQVHRIKLNTPQFVPILSFGSLWAQSIYFILISFYLFYFVSSSFLSFLLPFIPLPFIFHSYSF